MIEKHLISLDRVRRVPPHFSWIDHRLIRDHHLPRADATAWALYLVLVCAGDEHGMSYYSELSLGRLLSLNPGEVRAARSQLITASLIAYASPLYQVLSLDSPAHPHASVSNDRRPAATASNPTVVNPAATCATTTTCATAGIAPTSSPRTVRTGAPR